LKGISCNNLSWLKKLSESLEKIFKYNEFNCLFRKVPEIKLNEDFEIESLEYSGFLEYGGIDYVTISDSEIWYYSERTNEKKKIVEYECLSSFLKENGITLD